MSNSFMSTGAQTNTQKQLKPPCRREKHKSLSSESLFDRQTNLRQPESPTINQIRNQSHNCKTSIQALKARLGSISHDKEENSRVQEWARQKIRTLNSTRARVESDRREKEVLREAQLRQQEYLRDKVQEWRHFLKVKKQKSQEALNTEKNMIGQEVRSLRRESKILTRRNQLKEMEKNKERAEHMRSNHSEIMGAFKEEEMDMLKNVTYTRLRQKEEVAREKEHYVSLFNKLKAKEKRRMSELSKTENSKLQSIEQLKRALNSLSRKRSIHKTTIEGILSKSKRIDPKKSFSLL